MIKKVILISVAALLCLNLLSFEARSGSDDFIREYPDGSLGMDIGDGYEVAPVGLGGREELVMPEGYRDDYSNTRYGPMTQQGFVLFPDMKFSDSEKKDEEKKEREKKMSEKQVKDFIFQSGDETTSAAFEPSPIWGVYVPPKEDAKGE